MPKWNYFFKIDRACLESQPLNIRQQFGGIQFNDVVVTDTGKALQTAPFSFEDRESKNESRRMIKHMKWVAKHSSPQCNSILTRVNVASTGKMALETQVFDSTLKKFVRLKVKDIHSLSLGARRYIATASTAPLRSTLLDYTIPELKKLAREKKIKGFANKRKINLIDHILGNWI